MAQLLKPLSKKSQSAFSRFAPPAKSAAQLQAFKAKLAAFKANQRPK